MYLSKLELLGFKSFPDKTELAFDNGVTAIVGPNGCGKTNLLDAVRWVLGEQRVTLLRGSRMEEVIFNGTKELKPLGMAEVSLVIKNHKGILPIEYSDVRVTRRLYRSGESEYLLNGAPCRLKDIIDLFLDTGMGTHAYSVIQPAMIEAVLSDKAEDRRLLFEEASGITKYKLRKKATIRKLEITEGDILRVNDIITEVERQVSSLKRQMRRAERFKRFSEEATQLEIKLAQADFGDLKIENDRLEQDLLELKKRAREHTTDLSRQEAEVERLRLELLETEKELVAYQKKLASDVERVHQVERDVLVREERRTSLEKSITQLKQELSDLENRLKLFENEISAKREELVATTQKLQEKEKELSQKENELSIVDEKMEKVKAILEDLEKQKASKEEKINERKSKVANLEGSFKQLTQRRENLGREKDILSNRLNELKSQIDALLSACEQEKIILEGENAEKNKLEQEIKTNEGELERISKQEVKLSNDLSSEKAKLTLFQEIIKEYQGFQDGVKYILDKRSSLTGVIDSVANLINTDEKHISAIESALGEKAQFLICEDEASALRAIRFLEEHKEGRASFLILEKAKKIAKQSKAIDIKDHEGVIGWAFDLVRCEERYKPAIRFLLADVLVVDSFERAQKIAPMLKENLALVSLNGEVLKSEGILEGGSRKEIHLLGREKQMQGIAEVISVLENEFKKIQEEKQKGEDSLRSLNQSLSERVSYISRLSEEFSQKDMELKQKEFENKELTQRVETNVKELNRLQEEAEELRHSIEQMGLELESLERDNSELSKNVLETKEELDQIEEERNLQFEKTNSFRIDLVSLGGKEEQLENDLLRLNEMIDDIKKNINTRIEQTESSKKNIQEIALSNSNVDEELKGLFEQKETDEKIYNSWQGKYSELQQQVVSRESELKSIRQIREEFQTKVHNLELGKLEKATRMRGIRDKVWEEHQVNLEDLEPLSAEERGGLENYRQKIRSLKELVSRLGPVNLVALEEYKISKERLDFLKNQMKDLVEAKDSLNSTIGKIDETAREMFLETFQKVKANFQSVFAQLFEGGEADVVLQPDMDVLESPIEISARPRGKRLVNINQLSGGEKALTAISLIFAIYLVKPSPFCILDEIDAPLDDSNVKRFLKMIRHFSQNTQFLVITHNKLTMESADTLYGVTMEQPGVSKIVSVKLGRQEILAGDQV
ncbi:MAG: chromosome segregation protein SMC [candidate division Zixibacteria bacterium]|nr:chromosome segregation protein SMC [candidate division Zixibacteria bacterium]